MHNCQHNPSSSTHPANSNNLKRQPHPSAAGLTGGSSNLNRSGYILFLLFSILSVCSVLISLYFSRVVIYRQLMQQSIRQQHCNQLALSGIALAQAVLIPPKQKEETKEAQSKATAPGQPEQKILTALFPYFNKTKTHELTTKVDGIQATITLGIQSEQGKLNLNSLYDFDKRKFLYEGQANDRKKLCTWLFTRIATLTGKPTLMNVFEEHLKTRSKEFNDVTELLSIKEFAQQFEEQFFINTPSDSKNKLFLTDLFTVFSEQETITPWLFSQSWCLLLNLQPKQTLSTEELQKIFSTFKIDATWETDWNTSLQPFYQKEYKDIPQEIKSILTTRYEANIFSLLLKAKMTETISTIFTIVKANTKQHLSGFDIVKTYQID